MPLKYAFYPGCIIPSRFPHIEKSARLVAGHLGIELVEMENTTCCPEPFAIQSIDRMTHLSMAARNLCVGEEMNSDMMVLCNGCLATLWHANEILKTDYKARNAINKALEAIHRKFKGDLEVTHFYHVLADQIGVDKIGSAISKPLKGVKVAVHYGCHLLDPAFATRHDTINQPRGLERLVEAIGAQPVAYERQYTCCGGPIRGINDELSKSMLIEKLNAVKGAGADCLTLFCPLCYTQYDLGQLVEQRESRREFNLPVMYYPELLALALGYSKDEIGLSEHSITKNIEKIVP